MSVDLACATNAKILLRTEDPNQTTDPNPSVAFGSKVQNFNIERDREKSDMTKGEKK